MAEAPHYLRGDDCACGFAAGLGDVCTCPTGCICGADEVCTSRCERHDRVLHGYPCGACQDEWAAAHPRTSASILGSPAKVAAARRADAAAHTEPCRWNCRESVIRPEPWDCRSEACPNCTTAYVECADGTCYACDDLYAALGERLTRPVASTDTETTP